MTLLQILQTIDAIIDKQIKRVNIPAKFLFPVAWLMERIATVINIEPRVTMDSIRMAEKKMFFSSEKAMRELDYQYRPAKEAIKDAVAWFQDHGYGNRI